MYITKSLHMFCLAYIHETRPRVILVTECVDVRVCYRGSVGGSV